MAAKSKGTGRKKKWMQSVKSRIKKRGTAGSFRAYCQGKGYSKVTDA